MKRLFDIIVSALALIILSPVIAVVAVLVRVKLGSPVLFRQVRPGKDAKPFEMLKFRTMTDGRGVDGTLLPDSERLTAFGRFLRSSSLDELPELWNVLKGDMSLVGPRPLLKQYLPYYSVEERRRHLVRPGITGWSQINGRNTVSWDQRLGMDVWYVDKQNFWLDIKIIIKTISRVANRSGLVEDPRSVMNDFDVERSGTLEIRPLGSGEVEAAGHFIQQSYDPEIFAHTIIASAGFPRFLRDVLSKTDLLVGLFRHGELIGIFQARERGSDWHLNNFVISSDARGWGYSDLLLNKFHSLLDGRRAELFVDSRNPAAIRFYQRHGYRHVDAVNFTTVKFSLPQDKETTKVEILDKQRVEEYGFGHLRVDECKVDLGFISPDHAVSTDEISEKCLAAVRGVTFISKFTFPGGSTTIPNAERVHAWTRFTMVRD